MADRTPLTRRGLFRGVGSATLVASCTRTTPGTPTQTPSSDGALHPGEIGPAAAQLSFELNGLPVEVAVEPRTTLLDALRIDLDTTGPKKVCDRGACSACTVLVDGVQRNSCMMLAHDVEGRQVTTVEGLAKDGHLTVLQKKFVEHDALQCGFCTSGMLMSCVALLQRTSGRGSAISAHEVSEAIQGNLCRCGTYPHVVAAVIAASKERA
ncbi:MAG: (2Fe-2S)-binding protein [Nannocystaceae bacterium]|nr:(2Fe-2S)-binding protein [Nannocystaceae bacterium]